MTNETFNRLDDAAKQYWLENARNAVLAALQKSGVPLEQYHAVLVMVSAEIAEFLERNKGNE